MIPGFLNYIKKINQTAGLIFNLYYIIIKKSYQNLTDQFLIVVKPNAVSE